MAAKSQMKLERQRPTDSYSTGHKRIKIFSRGKSFSSMPCSHTEPEYKEERTPSKVPDYSDPFAIPGLLESFDRDKYGSVTKDFEALCTRRMQKLNPFFDMYHSLSSPKGNSATQSNKAGSGDSDLLKGLNIDVPMLVNQQTSHLTRQDIIDLEDDPAPNDVPVVAPVVIINSDEEDAGDLIGTRPSSSTLLQNILHDQEEIHEQRNAKLDQVTAVVAIWKPSYQYQQVVLRKPHEENQINELIARGGEEHIIEREEDGEHGAESESAQRGIYLGVENDVLGEGNKIEMEDDGMTEIWKEMALALECSKEDATECPNVGHSGDEGEEDECDHSFVLKDDIGYVCRVCGVIQRGIDTIFDFQWIKGTRNSRTYMHESRNNKDKELSEGVQFSGLKLCELDLTVADISVHPRHMKQMKPHQVEGFKFLVRNLITDNPGGCILAHAPGSGKTFMIISFIQSFLGKYPQARPLVVLPKGILGTWRKEFQRWQVEDFPLYDFYSSKAENRYQQLEILNNWVENKSILFLGYQQFSTIVCDTERCKTLDACQEILLKAPTILILDEGHTPRNENTNILLSLAKVQTPRKVVLSGTLYQNHVKEVFNILNLVRPKFLKLDTSRAIVRRIRSRVQVPDGRKNFKTGVDSVFFDLVEHTLQKDTDFKRKVTVIRDLREMTSNVLHYYKGDFLDELPGLVDFTVLLNLSRKQTTAIEKIKKLTKFKKSSNGSALYMHPCLKNVSKNVISEDRGSNAYDDKIDELLKFMDVKDGVKTKFFLNILSLCESAGEKLLVFSHYLLPLKFLERLVVNWKGWSPMKEFFFISGDSSSEQRELSMERFNNSPDAKVFFGSIKACGEGISLVGASRILILDVHLNPSVTRQAIGRAFRPGQEKKVYSYRLVAADSPEEEDHNSCFRKDLISKMWFEWNEYCGHQDFEMETISWKECGDLFLESHMLGEDVKVLYKR